MQGSLCSPAMTSHLSTSTGLGMGVTLTFSLIDRLSFFSDSQHLNLISACHTQAYWIISLFLLILVYVTEIIITVIVFCAINYRSCGLFIYFWIQGLIGESMCCFPSRWFGLLLLTIRLCFISVRIDYHCVWCPVPFLWERKEADSSGSGDGSLREEGKTVCLLPLPLPPVAQNNSCPPKIVLKYKFFVLLINPSTYCCYEKKVADIWKLKASTSNKAEGRHCQLTIPSDYGDWKSHSQSHSMRERTQASDIMDIPLERPPLTTIQKACDVYTFNTEKGGLTHL